jgi:hypothetical protein
MKVIARLGLAWLLMLAGATLVLDSGMADRRTRSQILAAVQSLGGLAFMGGGALMRRSATDRKHQL